jgi:metalloendopeptidase OMA1, mitochondrial
MLVFRPCALFLLHLALGCVSAHALSLTTAEQENKMGEDAYKEILKKEKLCTDKALIEFVENVARRITAAAPDKGFKYEVSVLESKTLNAFCLPGGKICVYTGILPFCENEAGLATVMGHEVAHAILRHGGQRMTQGAIVNVLGAGLEKVLESQGASDTAETVTMGAYQYASQLGILLPYSRSHEVEADLNGVLYMAKAGYDPHESVDFWRRFGTASSNVPTFMSTHPSHEDRAARLEKALPMALKAYEKSPKYGIGATVPGVVPGKRDPQSATPSVAENKPASKPESKNGKITIESLGIDEIIKGLRLALKRGTKSAITTLGKQDGFFKDELVKVVMPEKLVEVEKIVRSVGKGKVADDFILQMNRAAEDAVPATADVLAHAISSMTIEDARKILQGEKDAVTQYFKRTCSESLQQQILPIVQKSTDAVGATSSYKSFVKKGGFAAKALLGDFDLDQYVTQKAVAGLFVKIAEEEQRIRENPAELANDTLRKVFGAVLGK